MYQLYAYGMKYENCNRLYLIYPLTKKKLEHMEFNFNEKKEKELKLKILFFDLKNDEIS
jgi:5-methylcytosine-specific restriction enzyme subunit McrC